MKISTALAWSLLVLFHAWPTVTLALEKALVEVVIYEHSSGGDYTTHTYELEGTFSHAGAATSAEGDILEVSLSLAFYCRKYSVQIFAKHRSNIRTNFCRDQPLSAVLFISLRFAMIVFCRRLFFCV